jgi:hypothetical protein
VVAEEFAYDRVNLPTARWFYDLQAVLSAAGLVTVAKRGMKKAIRWGGGGGSTWPSLLFRRARHPRRRARAARSHARRGSSIPLSLRPGTGWPTVRRAASGGGSSQNRAALDPGAGHCRGGASFRGTPLG